MLSSLDHMTITAPSLEMGTEYVRRILGVEPQAGGEHPRMGTHNRFLKLGRKVYLEIIAVNQSANDSPSRCSSTWSASLVAGVMRPVGM